MESTEIVLNSLDNISNGLTISPSYDIIVYLFGSILFIAFLKFLFSSNPDEYTKKIIWWISILTFALVTHNNYIIWISLFIGWLLIATENFLMHLASIFSSKKWDDLSKVLDSFNKNWKKEFEAEKITKEEKQKEEEKNVEEEKEVINEIKESTTKHESSWPNRISYKDIYELESKIISHFLNSNKDILSKFLIENDIRIKNEYGNFILDWVIKDGNKIISWIEVKIISSPTRHIYMHIRRFIERIRYMKFDFPFILIVWAYEFDLNEINRVKNQFSSFDDIKILFYQIWENEQNWKFLNDLTSLKIPLWMEQWNSSLWRVIDIDWDLVTIKFEDWKIKTISRKELENNKS